MCLLMVFGSTVEVDKETKIFAVPEMLNVILSTVRIYVH